MKLSEGKVLTAAPKIMVILSEDQFPQRRHQNNWQTLTLVDINKISLDCNKDYSGLKDIFHPAVIKKKQTCFSLEPVENVSGVCYFP
ncbi:MAG: hypothetical protein V1742_08940 [Pseudomonadota bacterium]